MLTATGNCSRISSSVASGVCVTISRSKCRCSRSLAFGPGVPLRGSMEPVSRRCFLILAIVDRATFHFSAAWCSVIPLSQSSKIRLLISVGMGGIFDLLPFRFSISPGKTGH